MKRAKEKQKGFEGNFKGEYFASYEGLRFHKKTKKHIVFVGWGDIFAVQKVYIRRDVFKGMGYKNPKNVTIMMSFNELNGVSIR